MPRSPVCIACGRDLHRTSCVWDVRFAAPVVACPGCGRGLLRRDLVTRRRRRQAVRTVAAVQALLVNLLTMALAIGVGVGIASLLGFMDADQEFGPGQVLRAIRAEPLVRGLSIGPAALGLGAALAATQRHWLRAEVIGFYLLGVGILIGLEIAVIYTFDLHPITVTSNVAAEFVLINLLAIPFLLAFEGVATVHERRRTARRWAMRRWRRRWRARR